jgi:hypothetical protein
MVRHHPHPPGMSLRASVFLVLTTVLWGCNLTPIRPDAAFVLYRDRMKGEKAEEARSMLTPESRRYAVELGFDFKLSQIPENLALLNSLDPVSRPILEKAEDTEALLRVRTLRGGTRVVRMTRADPRAPWQIDLKNELSALRTFLEAKRALEMIRDQAGEYASSWRSFSEHLEVLPADEPEPETEAGPKTSKHPKPKRKR